MPAASGRVIEGGGGLIEDGKILAMEDLEPENNRKSLKQNSI